MQMISPRMLVVSACAVAAVGVSATSAFAGEVTGHGTPTPIRAFTAGSICSFSGLEDFASTEPQIPEDAILVSPGVTQHPMPGDLHGGDNACRGYAAGGGGGGA